jgi:hypothetical protein
VRAAARRRRGPGQAASGHNGAVPFHVQLSRGIFRSGHLFNLERGELVRRVLEPWHTGVVEIEDKRWVAAETELVVIEGPALPPSQLGIGQGWRNAVREGRDVTAALLGTGASAATSAPGARELARDAAAAASRRRVAVAGGPQQELLDGVVALLFALELEPVPWRGGPLPDAHAAIVVVGADAGGQPDAAALMLAGAASAAAPGRALLLEAGAQAPAAASEALQKLSLADEQAPARIADFLEAVGSPVRRDAAGWQDPARLRG